ncbi:MAG: cyclic nucleotide-binding domain-containing protein [Bacteroidota bacterium]
MPTLDEVKLELQKIPWFRDLTIGHLDKIAQITTLRHVKAGEVFFREGDLAEFVYVVLEGRVALDMLVPPRGRVRFSTAEKWDLFGWSGVTPVVRQRTAGATAVTDCVIAVADAEKLRQLCDEDHDLGYLVMRRMANLVAQRLLISRLQLLDMFGEPEAEHAQ